MKCYICTVVSGKLELLEHEAAKWLDKDSLDSVAWLPADLGLVDKLKDYLSKIVHNTDKANDRPQSIVF